MNVHDHLGRNGVLGHAILVWLIEQDNLTSSQSCLYLRAVREDDPGKRLFDLNDFLDGAFLHLTSD
jgi:hypothetical protein